MEVVKRLFGSNRCRCRSWFRGNLNAFELMKQMIEAGAAGVHFEDQLSSAKNAVILAEKFWFQLKKR